MHDSVYGAPPWAPRLIHDFAKWVKKQNHGTLGHFSIEATPIVPWDEWAPEERERMAAHAFCFLRLPEGSELALVNLGDGCPCPVVLLGSEGQVHTQAPSLEAFLIALSQGDTDLYDLDDDDDDDAAGRERLRAWLERQKVSAPIAPDFDFERWRATGEASAASSSGARASDAVARFAADRATLAALGLEDDFAKLVCLLGLRADDPELAAFMADVVGKRAPATLRGGDKWFSWTKAGVDLLFSAELENAKYPTLPKGKSFIPYLSTLNPAKRFAWTLPYGVSKGWERARLEAAFGPPSIHKHMHLEYKRWHVPLIAARDMVLSIYDDGALYLRIKADHESFAVAPA